MNTLTHVADAVVQLLVAFIVITLPHEAGHALVARLVGVRAVSLGLGLGPSLSVRVRGMRLSLGIVPVGATCGLGENYERGTTAWQRAQIAAAGPLASILTFCAIVAVTEIAYDHSLVRGMVNTGRVVLGMAATMLPSSPGTYLDLGNYAGPVGIAQMLIGGDIWSWTVGVAAITLGIGLFNLIPLPPLDGGRIAIALIELAFRRRLPKLAVGASAVGIALLVVFLTVVTVNDLFHLVR